MTSNITWSDVLGMKCYLINMDKCTDRLSYSKERISQAGFTNVHRFRGVDAELDDLPEAWSKHGSPKFDPTDTEFVQYKGKQGCALSHYGIWKDMMDNNVPFAIVFEDDVEFHCSWAELGKAYWESTPRDFDILYMGSQIEAETDANITVLPVFCTHAYMITLKGARILYNLCVNRPGGTSTIDCIIINHMNEAFMSNGRIMPFKWYVWNASMFPDSAKTKEGSKWAKRNAGLVYQDSTLGTFVRPW